ncbi:YjbQ family protein [Methanosalsum natronophilum]|uniref:YjbQ family protein n=1 Tax=Methanosalsum natronophilum TaxID=768733 RepID=A0A424YY87_9EURY|nr:YjbQ family protein [Methanosalsum natronophilum]MCS3923786.1 thiamine phosphate synthase YjbQ (UPF0047 family) [Methanosalsum natronophilum]RQD85237.1 MAG: hypothetical protein D5R95_05115 [Methanosalsum natronophilum]
MSVFDKTLTYKTQGNTDIIDITPDVIQIVEEAGIQDGILLVYSPRSTVSITTIEYEPGLIEDVNYHPMNRVASCFIIESNDSIPQA